MKRLVKGFGAPRVRFETESSLARPGARCVPWAIGALLVAALGSGCSGAPSSRLFPASTLEDGGGVSGESSAPPPIASGPSGIDGGGPSAPQTDGAPAPGPLTDSAPANGMPGPDGQTPLAAAWTNATGNLANMPSECGNLSLVSAKPDEDLLIASVSLFGLWGSRDGGRTWQTLGSGAGSAVITNRGSAIVYDPQHPMRFWESGIYNAGGVYETNDDGATFAQLGDVTHNDLVSVDFSDPNRKTLVAGGHEQPQTVYLSTDSGSTWAGIGSGLPAGSFCTNPLIIGPQTYLVGCDGNGNGPSGIYRTANAGGAWSNVATSGGAAAPLVASDNSIYWASPDGNGMTRSTDQGMNWTDVTPANTIDSVHPVELPDGRIASIGDQYLIVSADHGATWSQASAHLPYADATDLVYSSQEKAFYIWHFTCGFNGPVPVPTDAIMRFAFDYRTQ